VDLPAPFRHTSSFHPGDVRNFIAAFVYRRFKFFLSLLPGFPALYEPQHWLRILTGSGMGLVIAIALYPAFNQTVWKQPDERPAITNLISMAGLVLLTLILDSLILTENPFALYPIALISAGGGDYHLIHGL